MANNSRANIDATLLAQIQKAAVQWAIPGSMHFQMWDKVAATDKPCFFLRRPIDHVEQPKAYGLNRYVFKYEIWVYAQMDVNDLTVDPYATYIDPILDAINAAIAANPVSGRNNLSGLVDNCRISGDIFSLDGVDDGYIVMRIPLEVFTGI